MARALAERGRQAIVARHTCARRIDELMDIYHELEGVREPGVIREPNASGGTLTLGTTAG
jgi:hypothetical protein